VPTAGVGVRVSPWLLMDCRCGRCPVGFHKPDPSGSIPEPATDKRCGWASAHSGLISLDCRCATPGPATDSWPSTQTGKANRPRSCESAGSNPASVTDDGIPWSSGEDAWMTPRRWLGSIPAGITETRWSVGVVAAHRRGKAEDRVQFPDGPSTEAASRVARRVGRGRKRKTKNAGLHAVGGD
jgi:hypothetical protein